MPVISSECNLQHIVLDSYIPGAGNVQDFLRKVASRASNTDTGILHTFAKMTRASFTSNNDQSGKMFKIINYLKRGLNNTFEQEKKNGLEPSEDDMKMIDILENTLPDLIIKECSSQRELNNMKMGGRSRKSRRNRKSRKNRKSRRN